MNLDEAIAAHNRWKMRLRLYLKGASDPGIDPRTAHRDDQCELGKWIHGPGRDTFGRDLDFAVLEGHHRDFHEEVGRVVEACAVDPTKASELLDGPQFRTHSTNVVTAILRMKAKLGTGAGTP